MTKAWIKKSHYVHVINGRPLYSIRYGSVLGVGSKTSLREYLLKKTIVCYQIAYFFFQFDICIMLFVIESVKKMAPTLKNINLQGNCSTVKNI